MYFYQNKHGRLVALLVLYRYSLFLSIFYIAHSGSKGPQLYLLVRKRNSVVNCRRIKAHIRSKFPCFASCGNAHSGTSCGPAQLWVSSTCSPLPTTLRATGWWSVCRQIKNALHACGTDPAWHSHLPCMGVVRAM